jgi:MHS family metabolite:H+ symporter-like MFS transporter
MTGSWWPIAAMVVIYSVIGLVSAVLMPEVRDRDLNELEDAAEAKPGVQHVRGKHGALS